MPYVAVLDANVSHPIVTVEVLLRLADHDFFRPVWSRRILEEVQESLVRRGLDRDKIAHRIRVMEEHFPAVLAPDIARFLNAVPPQVDPDDHHVVAAALSAKPTQS